MGLRRRFLTFYACLTLHLWASQEHLIVGRHIARVEAEIGRTFEDDARKAGGYQSRRHVTSDKKMLVNAGSQHLNGQMSGLVEGNSTRLKNREPSARRLSTLTSEIAPGGVPVR